VHHRARRGATTHATHLVLCADRGRLNQEELEARTRSAETYLRDMADRSPWLPKSLRSEVLTGYNPADVILWRAEEDGADVIVVGARGHGAAARLLLGSVADKVVRGAQVPVLLCPTVLRA
jgi:nucleotide-binding universal stress UspA family protein